MPNPFLALNPLLLLYDIRDGAIRSRNEHLCAAFLVHIPRTIMIRLRYTRMKKYLPLLHQLLLEVLRKLLLPENFELGLLEPFLSDRLLALIIVITMNGFNHRLQDFHLALVLFSWRTRLLLGTL